VTTVIDQLGLTATFTETLSTRQHVDGTYGIIAPSGCTLESVVASDPGGPHPNVGGIMVDPATDEQGFDSRITQSYNASLNESLPLFVDPSDGIKTIWCSRLLDSVQSGGGGSGMYTMLQITVYASDPGENTIRPPGLYCANGKPVRHTSDINYTAVGPVTKPSGTTEPTWSSDLSFHKWPLVLQGSIVDSQKIAPTMTQVSYTGDQAPRSGELILGAISDSTDRVELINRVVRDALEIKAYVDIGLNGCIALGGFGYGYFPIMFFGGLFLADMTMQMRPADIIYSQQTVKFFAEHGCVWVGAGAPGYMNGKPLWGCKNSSSWPTPPPPYHNNHDVRDVVGGSREPHWIVHSSGTAQSGTISSITLAADTTGITANNYYPVYIVSGTGAGQLREVVSWDNGTKVAGVSPDWDTAPDNTSVYEYYNGGTYMTIALKNMMAAATAVVAAGKIGAWDNIEQLALCKRWVDEDGLINPRCLSQVDGSIFSPNSRKWADPAGTWTKKWYESVTFPTVPGALNQTIMPQSVT
jgi:hypothetical protein